MQGLRGGRQVTRSRLRLRPLCTSASRAGSLPPAGVTGPRRQDRKEAVPRSHPRAAFLRCPPPPAPPPRLRRVSRRLPAPGGEPGPHPGRQASGPPRLRAGAWLGGNIPGRGLGCGERHPERGRGIQKPWRGAGVDGGAAGGARGPAGPVVPGARWRGGTQRRQVGPSGPPLSPGNLARRGAAGRRAGPAGPQIPGPPSRAPGRGASA